MPTTGRCLCGKVSYTATGSLRDVHACHCTMCRKQSGHYVAAAAVARDGIEIEGAEHLTWYSTTPGIRRGFCRHCGAHLFWDWAESPDLSLNAGALEAPTGLSIEKHIFVADKGDYYEITDGLPQYAAYPGDD